MPKKNKRVGLSGILLFLGLAAVCAGAIYLAAREMGRSDATPEPPVDAAAPQAPSTPGPGSSRSTSPELASEPDPPANAGSPSPEDLAPLPETSRPAGDSLPPVPPEGFELPEPRPAPPGTRVAVVIDDLGRSLEDLAALRELGVPLSYAVLPFETRTPEVVEALRRRREEILLHLPMEAGGDANPGPGALSTGMDDRELIRETRAALARVPGAVGVNNHMGSVLSADDRSMRAVLSVLSEHGLYFLDSRTTVDTVGYRLASSLGIPSAERQVFLDRDVDPRLVTYQFRRLLELARTEGSAIAIGHPHPVTLEVLAEEIPRAVELGYELVPVSYLLDRPGGLAR